MRQNGFIGPVLSGLLVLMPMLVAPAKNSTVATKPSDVMWLFRAQRGRPSVICHLCQGDDIGDLRTRLRRLREKHSLTQEQFFELSGISYKYYQAIEAGRKWDLRLSTLERLANAYGIKIHSLLSPALPRTKMPRSRGRATERT